jgi:hypothetical protein
MPSFERALCALLVLRNGIHARVICLIVALYPSVVVFFVLTSFNSMCFSRQLRVDVECSFVLCSSYVLRLKPHLSHSMDSCTNCPISLLYCLRFAFAGVLFVPKHLLYFRCPLLALRSPLLP